MSPDFPAFTSPPLRQSEGSETHHISVAAGGACARSDMHVAGVYARLVHVATALTASSASVPVALAPCPVGGSVTAHTLLANRSPLPLSFFLVVPPALAAVVTVTPMEGTLPAGAFQPLTWRHSPVAAGVVADSVQCVYSDAASPDAAVAEHTCVISVTAAVGSGDLLLEGSLDFGAVLVGRRAVRSVELYNPSHVPVQFDLSHDGGPSIAIHPTKVLPLP